MSVSVTKCSESSGRTLTSGAGEVPVSAAFSSRTIAIVC